jgi:hypothetical protein
MTPEKKAERIIKMFYREIPLYPNKHEFAKSIAILHVQGIMNELNESCEVGYVKVSRLQYWNEVLTILKSK